MSSTDGSPFMQLPTEIREMILRYVLVAQSAKSDYDWMRSKDFDWNRSYLQKSLDYCYYFYTAIMRTNRRIHQESVTLCRRENDFVCLTSSQPSTLGRLLRDRGLETIAEGPTVQGFWTSSMTLTIDSIDSEDLPDCSAYDSVNGQPLNYIFCADELPTFCRLLLKRHKNSDGRFLRNTSIQININGDIWNGEPTDIDRSIPVGLSRMQKLLGPLDQLHSFRTAQIQGPLSGSYKTNIISNLLRDGPSALEILPNVVMSLDRGDKQVEHNLPFHAIQEYKAALNHVRSCCWLYEERHFLMEDGPFPNLSAAQTTHNLKVRLLARIASVYRNLGMLRMARIYTERAFDPRRPLDDRANKLYCLKLEPWQKVVYAEVLRVSAKIRYQYGHISEALNQIREAGEYTALNEEQKERLEAWQAHGDSLRDRHAKRDEAKDLQRKKQGEKVEEKFLVVCNWKRKGDTLLRNGRSELATTTYRKALDKLELLDHYICWEIQSGPFQGYWLRRGYSSLKVKLQTSVAASCLMSRRFRETVRSAEIAVACDPDCHSYRHLCCRNAYRSNENDWAEDYRLDGARAHYCKALAREQRGSISGAIKDMETALQYDDGDGTSFAQLTRLRMKLRSRHEKIGVKKVKNLNAAQDRLHRKQVARKEKGKS